MPGQPPCHARHVRAPQQVGGRAGAAVLRHNGRWGPRPHRPRIRARPTPFHRFAPRPDSARRRRGTPCQPAGLLSADRALALNTSDAPAEREKREFNDPPGSIWRACVLPYTGITDMRRTVFRTVTDADAARRGDWLRQAGRRPPRSWTDCG